MLGVKTHSVSIWSIATVFFVAAISHAQTLDTLPFDKKLRLARSGDEAAQIAVAGAYESGNDTIINRVEAVKWYRKAADRGNPEAMFRLARIVSAGAGGVKNNPELAAKLYESA